MNQQALFRRVAAVVHHGDARAGAPQVVIPQHYWAGRIAEPGAGTAHAPGAPATDH